MTITSSNRLQRVLARAPANLVSAACVATFNHGKALFSAFGNRLLITKDKAVRVLPVAQKCVEQMKNLVTQKSDLAATVKQSTWDIGVSFFSRQADAILSGTTGPSLASVGKENIIQLASSISEKVAGNCTALVPAMQETVTSLQETVGLIPDLSASSMKDFFLGVLESEATLATMSTALTDTVCDICFDVVGEKTNGTVAQLARQVVKGALATGVFAVSGVAIEAALVSYISIRSLTGIARLVFTQ